MRRLNSLIFMGTECHRQKCSHKTQLLMSCMGNFLISYPTLALSKLSSLILSREVCFVGVSIQHSAYRGKKKMSREYLTMQVHYVNTAQLHLVVGHYFPWVLWFVLTCYWRSNHKLLKGNGVWGADGGEPRSTGIRAWRSKNTFGLISRLPKYGPQAMQQHVPTALRSDR